jgi:flagellar biosynthetic protein FliQ
MTEDIVMSIGADAIKTAIYIAGPLLIAAMAVGIIVSLIQAVTQINESTLTFIPKMIAILLVLMVMAPWMLEVMETYTIRTITDAGELVR